MSAQSVFVKTASFIVLMSIRWDLYPGSRHYRQTRCVTLEWVDNGLTPIFCRCFVSTSQINYYPGYSNQWIGRGLLVFKNMQNVIYWHGIIWAVWNENVIFFTLDNISETFLSRIPSSRSSIESTCQASWISFPSSCQISREILALLYSVAKACDTNRLLLNVILFSQFNCFHSNKKVKKSLNNGSK